MPGGDPLDGICTLADATKGISRARARSSPRSTRAQGTLTCKLFDDKAPITVANFVGLARGTRPWKDPSGQVGQRSPRTTGRTFHRIIKGFMIQGGDAKGNGSGEPGYVIKDEIWEGAKHDRAGLLCMANRGPNTNGAQFFITDASAPHLDGSYTIFGECAPGRDRAHHRERARERRAGQTAIARHDPQDHDHACAHRAQSRSQARATPPRQD